MRRIVIMIVGARVAIVLPVNGALNCSTYCTTRDVCMHNAYNRASPLDILYYIYYITPTA